jgi:predicted nucleic acid-binding protein
LITKPVLIDTGPLVAILYEREQHHRRCVEQARDLPETLYTCWPVVAEAAYLLRPSRKGVSTLLSEIDRGRLIVLPLDVADVRPVQTILERYAEQQLDLADACLLHLAEREGMRYVFTLDLRHFAILRTSSGETLELLPAQ